MHASIEQLEEMENTCSMLGISTNYRADKLTDRELLEVYGPECVGIIKQKIQEYEEERKRFDDGHSRWIEYVAKYLLYAKDLSRWFWFDGVWECEHKPRIEFLESGIKRLKRLLEVHKNKGKKTNSITDEHIQDAKRVPIEQFYEGRLRPSGGKLCGSCPFHQERTGSFFIYIETNTWHCFGQCGGGDSISFIMKKQELGFLDAVRYLLKS